MTWKLTRIAVPSLSVRVVLTQKNPWSHCSGGVRIPSPHVRGVLLALGVVLGVAVVVPVAVPVLVFVSEIDGVGELVGVAVVVPVVLTVGVAVRVPVVEMDGVRVGVTEGVGATEHTPALLHLYVGVPNGFSGVISGQDVPVAPPMIWHVDEQQVVPQ